MNTDTILYAFGLCKRQGTPGMLAVDLLLAGSAVVIAWASYRQKNWVLFGWACAVFGIRITIALKL